jgi:ATP-dependent RNA helicase SUPV3L1/SUV3
VDLYQNGDVDHIIATDAIGMGLNLDVDHVAFAGDRKFDGWQHRRLNPAEFGQIAGRAGRHLKDGTFGTTGRCLPFDADLVEALEDHRFDPVEVLQWRNADLDFTSIGALQASLERQPSEAGLVRAPLAEDVLVLDVASHDAEVRKQAKTRADIERLWDVCQIPDYRKVSPAAHAELVLTLFGFVVRAGRISDDWFRQQLATFDRTDGDIDILSARIAQVRTWNYIANRPDWLGDPEHWQGVTRQVEDKLSDALHERLAHRFVDRRTSVLMRRLRENAMLEAEVTANGDVLVERQFIGHLHGFRFTPDPHAAGEAARALNAAALKALASEIDGRAQRIHEAVDEAFVLANDGTLRWLGEAVGKLAPGDHVLKPKIRVLADDQLSGGSLDMVKRRLDLWIAQHVKKLLGALDELEAGEGLEGIARGIAFQVAESLGVLERARVAAEMKTLPQEGRAALRKFGVRFGAYHLYLPQLVKPAPRALSAQLWALREGGVEIVKGLDDVPHFAASGRTSFPADKDVPKGLYLAAGFRLCGERAVRVDILERLADLIRPAIAYRPGVTPGKPPQGTADGDGFVVTISMTSLAGCSGDAFASILRSLGYVAESRKGPAITVPLLAPAPQVPIEVLPQTAAEVEAAPEAQAPAAEPIMVAEPAVESGETTEPAPTETQPADPPVEPEAQPSDVAEATQSTSEVASPAATEQVAEASVAEFAPSVEPAAAEAEVVEVPTEIPLIEVWHPHRHHNANRRPEHHRGRPQRREAAAVQASAPAEPQAEANPAGPEGEGGNRQARQDFRSRRDSRPGDRNRRESAPEGRRPEGKAEEMRPRHQGKNGGERRRDNDRENRRGNRPFATSEKPVQRERQPDPNSPFAKLLALKDELERRAKKENP